MRLTRTVVPAIAVVLLTAFAATSFAQANRALQINHAVYGKEGKGKDVTNRYTYMGRRLHKTVNEHDRLRLP